MNGAINPISYTSLSGPADYQANSASIKRYTPTTKILVCPSEKANSLILYF